MAHKPGDIRLPKKLDENEEVEKYLNEMRTSEAKRKEIEKAIREMPYIL